MTGDEENKCKGMGYGQPCNIAREPDSEFCICHLKDGGKDPKRFWDEVNRILDNTDTEPLDFVDFFFVPQVGETIIDFRDKTFSQEVNFSGATFSQEVNFVNANFPEFTAFLFATFFQEVNFNGAIFSQEVRFGNATFKSANFWETKFYGNADFQNATFKSANFWYATFYKDVNFRNATFYKDVGSEQANVKFKQTIFKGKARFQKSVFEIPSSFKGAEFNKVYFKNANFEKKLDFSEVFIESYAKFTKTKFRSEVEFRECDFGEPVKISFNSVNLSNTSFKNTDLSKINFENCTWAKIDKGFISIQRILGEENRRFGLYDEFKLREEKKEGKKPISDDYSFIETLNRQLKYNYEEKRNYPDAGEFYISEMEMRRLNPDTPTSKKVILTPYKVLGLYGEAVARPIFWFTILILFSTFEFHHIGDSNIIWVESFKTALRFAYLRPDFDSTRTFLEVLLGLFTSVIGVTLIALTAIGIKRQVRR